MTDAHTILEMTAREKSETTIALLHRLWACERAREGRPDDSVGTDTVLVLRSLLGRLMGCAPADVPGDGPHGAARDYRITGFCNPKIQAEMSVSKWQN